MFDILPKKVVYAGPRVLQLQWKLPARLRKPIRQQLRKERAQRQRRQAAAVTFARKPIHTQPLLVADEESKQPGRRVQAPRRFFNRGAEHHTNDVYTQGKPELHVAAPPYVGRVARSGVRKPVQVPAFKPPAPAPVRQSVPVRVRPVQQHAPSPMPIIDRDVPMQWQQPAAKPVPVITNDELFVQVEKPKKQFMPAVTFNLWPKKLFSFATTAKKKLI